MTGTATNSSHIDRSMSAPVHMHAHACTMRMHVSRNTVTVLDPSLHMHGAQVLDIASSISIRSIELMKAYST